MLFHLIQTSPIFPPHTIIGASLTVLCRSTNHAPLLVKPSDPASLTSFSLRSSASLQSRSLCGPSRSTQFQAITSGSAAAFRSGTASGSQIGAATRGANQGDRGVISERSEWKGQRSGWRLKGCRRTEEANGK